MLVLSAFFFFGKNEPHTTLLLAPIILQNIGRMCGGVLVCGGGQGLDFRESYRICAVVVGLAIYFFVSFSLCLSPQTSPPRAMVDDTVYLFFSFSFFLSIMVLGERWSVAVVGSGWAFFGCLIEGGSDP